MANPAYVQSTGVAPYTGSSIAFTLTSTPTVGNILLAFCNYSQYGTSRTIATPSGWTKVSDHTNTAGGNGFDSQAVFWHAVGSGDGRTWTFTVSNATDNVSGELYEISGASTTSPVNGSVGTADYNGTLTTIATASVTPSVLNCLPVAAIALDETSDTAATAGTGWTTDQQEFGNYHPGASAHMNADTSDTTTAITVSFTITGSTSSDSGCSAIVLIAPAASTPTNIGQFFAFF